MLEDALSGKPHHDPIGWPTFKDWPAPNSLTHEGTYYKWLERSWRGGQRIFVNLLVENNQLCMLYPIKRNSCDDMDSVRLQAHDMYKMQDYIDAQFGGPGKGFYRIVKSPFQARKVINAGKMAVVMGIETSVPFGCSMKLDVPTCAISDIDRQLDEVRKLGVRQMELVNKFDNALAGVAGDTGEVGALVNAANFLETGSFWDMRHCEPADGESHDKDQVAAPGINAGQQDALFGADRPARTADHRAAALPAAGPLQRARPDHARRAHDQGAGPAAHDLRPDHMSVKARSSALDTIDELGYHGVVSSHSWATPDAYPRIYRRAGSSRRTPGLHGLRRQVAHPCRLGGPALLLGHRVRRGHERPRRAGQPSRRRCRNPVTYPFKGIEGATIGARTAGLRTWDINTDGVAQYGLYPDWIQDLARSRAPDSADGRNITEDISRGPEAYLQMWERAEGIKPDSCRNPSLRRHVSIRPAVDPPRHVHARGDERRRTALHPPWPHLRVLRQGQGPPDGADDRDVHAGRKGRLAASRPLAARGRHPAEGRHRHRALEAGDGQQEPVPTHAADLGVLDRTVGALHDRAPLHLGQRTALGTERRVHVAPPGHSCSRPRASRRRADTRPVVAIATDNRCERRSNRLPTHSWCSRRGTRGGGDRTRDGCLVLCPSALRRQRGRQGPAAGLGAGDPGAVLGRADRGRHARGPRAGHQRAHPRSTGRAQPDRGLGPDRGRRAGDQRGGPGQPWLCGSPAVHRRPDAWPRAVHRRHAEQLVAVDRSSGTRVAARLPL